MARASDRIAALEQQLAQANIQGNRHVCQSIVTPVKFSGAIGESVEDFFADFTRYRNNNHIPDERIADHIVDFLTGLAREFYRTLGQRDRASLERLREVFVQHFNSRSRTQVALQKFYRADQLPNESVSSFYCRLKSLARAAFPDLDQITRSQNVASRLLQGFVPQIRRTLAGRELDNPEVIRSAAEAVEIELSSIPVEPTVATSDDIKQLIAEIRQTNIAQPIRSLNLMH